MKNNKRWLWFAALYIGSVLALVLIGAAIKWLLLGL